MTTLRDHRLPMRYWTFLIVGDIGDPELGAGWIRAETSQEALHLVGHDDAQAMELPDDSGFPPEAIGSIFWASRAPCLAN